MSIFFIQYLRIRIGKEMIHKFTKIYRNITVIYTCLQNTENNISKNSRLVNTLLCAYKVSYIVIDNCDSEIYI